MAKKLAKKTGAKIAKKRTGANDARVENNAKTTRGKPFEPGNKFGFRPGQSGNPGGRPKTKQFAEAARKWLASNYERSPHLSNAEALAEFLGKEALGGEIAAARVLIEYAEGRPRQALEISTDDRMRQIIEKALPMLTATGLNEEEAKRYLREFVPEVSTWIN